jgi:uncharacterized protein (DUF305 family)
MTLRRTLLPVAVAVAALLSLAAGGCGGASSEDGRGGGNPTERAFLSAMVPHHRSAVEMAAAAEDRIDDPELERLVAAIGAAQTTEIEEMDQIHQRLFGQPLRPDEAAHMQLGLSAAAAGMGHMDAARDVRRADEPVDRVLIDEMIPHHRGAIAMARVVAQRGQDPRLRELAQDIVATQESEIEEMNSIREREYGAIFEEDAPGGGHSR